MFKSPARNLLEILACAALLAGCGSDEGATEGHDHSSHTMGDAGQAANHEARESADEITLGLTKEGEQGAISAELLEATPSPPDDDGLNVWKVKLHDMSTGEPADVGVTRLHLDMPNHDHGTQTAPQVSQLDEPGVWEWAQMKLHMGGLWTIDAYLCEEGTDPDACDDTNESWIDTVQFRVWIVEE